MKKAGTCAGLFARTRSALFYKQQASICRQQAAKSPQQPLAAKAATEVPNSTNAADNLMNLDVMVRFLVSGLKKSKHRSRSWLISVRRGPDVGQRRRDVVTAEHRQAVWQTGHERLTGSGCRRSGHTATLAIHAGAGRNALTPFRTAMAIPGGDGHSRLCRKQAQHQGKHPGKTVGHGGDLISCKCI